MGIQVEYNPDLALRNFDKIKSEGRKKEECIPTGLEEGKVYKFLKKDQRNFWIHGPIPLIETKGNKVLSRPVARIKILEATHFLKKSEVWTKGEYKVLEVFKDNKIHFECFDPIGIRRNFKSK